MRQLSFRDWVLHIQALPMLTCSRILILLVPFKRMASVLGQLNYVTSPEGNGVTDYDQVKRTGTILSALSQYLPWRSLCFEQALAGMMLLRCKGISSTIYFGVYQSKNSIEAHAWLRSGDRIVTGARGRERFTVVFTVASAPSKEAGLMPFERPVSNIEYSDNVSTVAQKP